MATSNDTGASAYGQRIAGKDSSSGYTVDINSTNGAAHVTSVDPSELVHNRYRTGITATIATGTKTVTFTQAENVRSVRFYFSTANLFRVVFDASSDADAQAKLATAADSATNDVQYHLIEGPTIATREFSKNPDDQSLSRIDMVADSNAGPHTVYVEGR